MKHVFQEVRIREGYVTDLYFTYKILSKLKLPLSSQILTKDSSKNKIINIVDPLKEYVRPTSRHSIRPQLTLVITKSTLLRADNLITLIIPSPGSRQMNI